MHAYDCPNCGAKVTFQSSVAVFAVCPFCRSTVVRKDVAVEQLGKMAELPPDLSPLQIGTRGSFDGQAFTLVGRVRLRWEEGSWTEWCAWFGDQRYGWVAEAQGFFMVSFEYAPPDDLPSRGDLVPGTTLTFADREYRVVDIKENHCIGTEGELPFVAAAGREGVTVDCMGDGGAFACVEYSDAGARLYLGRYARLNELEVTDLRPVPGWTPGVEADARRGASGACSCPACGAPMELRAAGWTMSAVCPSCGSLLDTSDAQLQLIERAQAQQRIEPLLPLGTRGTLFGTPWEIIGFLERKDAYAAWYEYLLFNPWEGFRWLVNYQGHWSFVTALIERPDTGPPGQDVRRIAFRGETYRLFARGGAIVTYVLGEFYWQTRVGETTYLCDYVCPPRILSSERYPELLEETWSQGEYVEPRAIETAFGLSQPLPERTGIYLNQTNPFGERWRRVRWMAPVLVLALLVIELVSASRAARRQVFAGEFLYRAADTNRTVVTEPFEIPGGRQALRFSSRASVNNNWIALGFDLVDTETQQTRSLEQGIEQYSGYDDGPWTEGKPTADTILPGVAPGRYVLRIEPTADPGVVEMPYAVAVIRDVPVWSNFWLGLGLLLVYPVYAFFRHVTFESARWSESDYSPLGQSKESEDES